MAFRDERHDIFRTSRNATERKLIPANPLRGYPRPSEARPQGLHHPGTGSLAQEARQTLLVEGDLGLHPHRGPVRAGVLQAASGVGSRPWHLAELMGDTVETCMKHYLEWSDAYQERLLRAC